MIASNLQLRVDRVCSPKSSDISAEPATQIILRDTMRGVAMKRIKLTQGKFTIVDNEDYEWLNQWKWYAAKGVVTFYAKRCPNERIIIMHRVIMNTPHGMDTDHKNGNGLDNRKCNLRICTRSQHHHNRKPKKGKYKGVSRGGQVGKWQARITTSGKRTSLGFFNSKKAAAKAYNQKAVELFGEFARLNNV